MSRPVFPACWLLVSACCLSGCRIGAPMHVWEPPVLASTVGKQVVVSTIAGPEDVARRVREKLLTMAPQDSGRQTTLIDFQELQANSELQLVSATDEEPNDLALASVARRQGSEFLLRGEVIQRRQLGDEPHHEPQVEAPESLTISWRLISLDRGLSGGGIPINIDFAQAIETYPDLKLVTDREEVLTTAAVRESYRLLTPSVRRDRVRIEVPYLMPGSAEVRRGNAAAQAGRWGEAAQIWSEALRRHPAQVAAIHNLALAAAAAQDFSRAKLLARRAIRLHPSQLHKESLVWIETRQRDYHQAFDLPDPPEGWFVTGDVTANGTRGGNEVATRRGGLSDQAPPQVASAAEPAR